MQKRLNIMYLIKIQFQYQGNKINNAKISLCITIKETC